MRIFILLCFLLITPNAGAEVTESLRYNYYYANAVSGRSLKGILNASSPIRENGQNYNGYTKWYVKWNFHWIRSPEGSCKISKVKTEVTGTITMPRLVRPNSIQEGQFKTYIEALNLHELGHYELGKEAAAAVDEKILALPEMASCAALESVANNLGHQTLNEYKERERQYDAATEHGRSQGAWLER